MGIFSSLLKKKKKSEPEQPKILNAIDVEPTEDETVYMYWYIEEYACLSCPDGSHGIRNTELTWRVDIVDGVRWLLLIGVYNHSEIKRFTYPKNIERDFWVASYP